MPGEKPADNKVERRRSPSAAFPLVHPQPTELGRKDKKKRQARPPHAADEWRGAVSEERLTTLMANCVNPEIPGPIVIIGSRIIERYGALEPSIVEQLAVRGVPIDRLILVPETRQVEVQDRYPDARVVPGFNYADSRTWNVAYLSEPASAVLSAVEDFFGPEEQRREYFYKIVAALQRGGRFIQAYSYDGRRIEHDTNRIELESAIQIVRNEKREQQVWVYRAPGGSAKKVEGRGAVRLRSKAEPLQSVDDIHRNKSARRVRQEFVSSAAAELQTYEATDQPAILTEIAVKAGFVAVVTKASGIKLRKLPTKAPELWLDRDRSKDGTEDEESPADFIKRVYGRWMGRGLTQAAVDHLDHSLYDAYHQWQTKGGKPPKDFDFPSKSDWYKRLYRDPSLFDQLSSREKYLVVQSVANAYKSADKSSRKR